VARAGTLIFAVTVVVWALAYYPRSDAQVSAEIAAQRQQLQSVANMASGETSRIGRTVARGI